MIARLRLGSTRIQRQERTALVIGLLSCSVSLEWVIQRGWHIYNEFVQRWRGVEVGGTGEGEMLRRRGTAAPPRRTALKFGYYTQNYCQNFDDGHNSLGHYRL
jgi:hypothetical protein